MVSRYPCRYPPTCWPGIGIAPCAQVAAGHRINMQVDAPIAIGRSRSTQDALRHPRRYSDIKSTYMLQDEARMTRATGLRITCPMCYAGHVVENVSICHRKTRKQDRTDWTDVTPFPQSFKRARPHGGTFVKHPSICPMCPIAICPILQAIDYIAGKHLLIYSANVSG